MKKISSSYPEDQLDDVQERVEGEEPDPEEGEYPNRAEALRDLVGKGLIYDERVEELETEIQHLEARIDELTNQLQHERERQEDVTEVVEYVEREKLKEKEREAANVVERAKWWLFGRDLEDVDGGRAPDRAGGGREE